MKIREMVSSKQNDTGINDNVRKASEHRTPKKTPSQKETQRKRRRNHDLSESSPAGERELPIKTKAERTCNE